MLMRFVLPSRLRSYSLTFGSTTRVVLCISGSTLNEMICRIFRAHGVFCASHTWEVILAFLTLTACMYNVDITTLFDSLAESPVAADAAKAARASAIPRAAHQHHQHHQQQILQRQRQCQGWRDSCDGFETEYNAADVILMTIVRCSAVLYSYYQFLNLHKFGSKYILGEF